MKIMIALVSMVTVANAALINGHFYADVCGQIQNEAIEADVVAAEKVCLGKTLLVQKTETVRIHFNDQSIKNYEIVGKKILTTRFHETESPIELTLKNLENPGEIITIDVIQDVQVDAPFPYNLIRMQGVAPIKFDTGKIEYMVNIL